MKEAKFTPGPWEIGDGGSVVTQTPDAQVDMSNYQPPGLPDYDVQDTISFYGGHVICETVTNANARLIAAAPDLFAACVAFVEAHRKSLQFEKTDVARRMAERAIEKALGDLPESKITQGDQNDE